MKKYLMILSSITAIGIGAIGNTISTEKNNIINNKETTKKETLGNYYLISTDTSKYDITDGPQTIYLNDLLTLFKELNKVHKEKNTDVALYGLSNWLLITDDGLNFALGWINANAFVNLHGLINSDFIDFKNVSMNISNNQINVYLNYKIADAEQMLELFSYSGDNIPLQQEKMTTYFELHYEINE